MNAPTDGIAPVTGNSYSADTLYLAGQMEALANSADWDSVEKISLKIRRRISNLPEHDRRETIHIVLKALEKAQEIALTSRHDISDKLADLQRGRAAMQAYGDLSG